MTRIIIESNGNVYDGRDATRGVIENPHGKLKLIARFEWRKTRNNEFEYVAVIINESLIQILKYIKHPQNITLTISDLYDKIKENPDNLSDSAIQTEIDNVECIELIQLELMIHIEKKFFLDKMFKIKHIPPYIQNEPYPIIDWKGYRLQPGEKYTPEQKFMEINFKHKKRIGEMYYNQNELVIKVDTDGKTILSPKYPLTTWVQLVQNSEGLNEGHDAVEALNNIDNVQNRLPSWTLRNDNGWAHCAADDLNKKLIDFNRNNIYYISHIAINPHTFVEFMCNMNENIDSNIVHSGAVMLFPGFNHQFGKLIAVIDDAVPRRILYCISDKINLFFKGQSTTVLSKRINENTHEHLVNRSQLSDYTVYNKLSNIGYKCGMILTINDD